MDRIPCIEDPIMFLWACILAFVLEFSVALLLLRCFYTLREGMLDILGRSAERMCPASDPLFDLRALQPSAQEAADPTAELRHDPAHDSYDGACRGRDTYYFRVE
jgi:hypothetical protein